MQAANDNLPEGVDGFDDWETLYEAARKVVEACSDSTALHQLPGSGGMAPGGQTDVENGRRADHANCPSTAGAVPWRA